jgi:hypothetical protein
MKKIDLDDVKHELFVKMHGIDANESLVNYIGAQDFANYEASRRVDGRAVEMVSIAKDKLFDFIETNKRGRLFRFDTYIGLKGERDAFQVILGAQSTDVTIKEKLDKMIAVRLVAFKIRSKPPRRTTLQPQSKLKVLKVIVAPTGSLP